jgi:hypothetical protein
MSESSSTFSATGIAASSEPTHAVEWLRDEWELERLLGSGSQGQVWAARHKTAKKRTAAVKMLRDCDDAWHEIDAYRQLSRFHQHPNVLDIIFGLHDGCVLPPPPWAVVMPHASLSAICARHP